MYVLKLVTAYGVSAGVLGLRDVGMIAGCWYDGGMIAGC